MRHSSIPRNAFTRAAMSRLPMVASPLSLNT
jgi:hypothetical protein